MSAGIDAGQQVLSGWGGRPRSGARVVTIAGADDIDRSAVGPRGVLPRGLGRSYGDAALNAGGLVYDCTANSGIVTFDRAAGTVTVRAGTSLDGLLRALVPAGWIPAVLPGTRHVTVGGAIAADIHGKNHHRDGSFARHVRSMVVVTPGQEPRTLLPGDDAFAATAGGMGLTGIITEATLALQPITTSRMRVDTERAGDLDDALDRMAARDDDYRYSVAWIDLLARGAATGRCVLTRAEHASVGELPAPARGDPLAYRPTTRVRVPAAVPSGVLRPAGVRAFNEVWFRRAPRREQGRIRPLAAYFHPLDGIAGWNRLYGPRGFLQYQFVVPRGAEATLRRVVERLVTARCPSLLAVLKRFGPADGLLSFPLPGWTLAVDIPVGVDGLPRLLNGLDEAVVAAGGRVYLAKDSRMAPETVRAMYPALARWQAIRDRLDPAGVMRSDLARRLDL